MDEMAAINPSRQEALVPVDGEKASKTSDHGCNFQAAKTGKKVLI